MLVPNTSLYKNVQVYFNSRKSSAIINKTHINNFFEIITALAGLYSGTRWCCVVMVDHQIICELKYKIPISFDVQGVQWKQPSFLLATKCYFVFQIKINKVEKIKLFT
jgi:hypothetical protein